MAAMADKLKKTLETKKSSSNRLSRKRFSSLSFVKPSKENYNQLRGEIEQLRKQKIERQDEVES